MFINFFYLLRDYGVPVSITEWMTLMEALSRGMANSSLTEFYYLARSVLVKSEAYFDRYDLAFAQYFSKIETFDQFAGEVLKWLENALPPLKISAAEKKQFENWDLKELRKELEKRLKEQTEEHHGGSHWIGTGGTSRFGHSGYHPAGIRIGGKSVNRSAVQVAAERKFRDFRQDKTLGIRQFETALRKLRLLSSKVDGPRDKLDLEETINATSKKGGLLELVWTRSRKNTVKIALLMDSGGSMNPYLKVCSQLFSAVNRSTHFKDMKFYYFHNCIYERVFLDPLCRPRASLKTEDFLKITGPEYKVIIVGDASMAPSELTMVGGAIDWNLSNKEPGITWLQRLATHFTHAVWLNPIPKEYWHLTEGAYTIAMIKELFPMYELTLEGLEQAVKKLQVKK